MAWYMSGKLKLNKDENQAWKKLSDHLFQKTGAASIHQLHPEVNKTHKHFSGTKRDINRSSSYFNNWIIRIAAAILLAGGISCFFYLNNSYSFWTSSSDSEVSTQRFMQEIDTKPGQRVHISFSDGTSIFLNASSSIRFPKHFDNGIRKVELKGEAYFSVAHNAAIPFIIYTNKGEVQDLGTKFNVSAYPQDSSMKVAVAEGKVAVQLNMPDLDKKQKSNINYTKAYKVILTSNQYTEVTNGNISAPQTVNVDRYIGWTKGKLIFKATPLKKVIKKLEHYYDVHFIVSDSTLYNLRLTATFKQETIQKILDVISLTMSMKYEKKSGKNNVIVLSPDETKRTNHHAPS
jgi:ferric-dicitrate binding protein FerR (iron transport regulator)